jgi:hypothetical protein
MRGWRAILMLAGALAVAAVGFGCGGDGSTEVTASADVEKPTYIKKADAVCKQANIRIEDGWEDFVKGRGGDPTKAFEGEDAENEFTATVVLPGKQWQVDELAKLAAPESDQKEVEAILAAYQEGIDVGEADPERVTSSQGVFKYAAKTAEDYGLRECRW